MTRYKADSGWFVQKNPGYIRSWVETTPVTQCLPLKELCHLRGATNYPHDHVSWPYGSYSRKIVFKWATLVDGDPVVGPGGAGGGRSTSAQLIGCKGG